MSGILAPEQESGKCLQLFGNELVWYFHNLCDVLAFK